MSRIVGTDPANNDVLAIAEWIAEDSLTAAERWIDRIDQTPALIAQYPLVGEAVDHLQQGMRRFCIGNYLLFYRPLNNGIELLRVLHGPRRIEDLFD